MKFICFSILAAISSLTFLAVSIEWIRSEFAYDTFYRIQSTSTPGPFYSLGITFDDGRIAVVLRTGTAAGIVPPVPWRHVPTSAYRAHGSFDHVHWFWFHKEDSPGEEVQHEYRFIGRLWMLAAITLILPLIWLRQFIRRRRLEMVGKCRCCGYDLRASPNRCPECGKPSGAQ